MTLNDGISRRDLLRAGAGAAAAGLASTTPLAWARAGSSWPGGRLGARDAKRVTDAQFMPTSQFRKWNEELDRVGPRNQRGLRATGSRSERDYADELHNLLDRAGVSKLDFEPVPMRRWSVDEWSLDLVTGTAGPVRTASYIPYSGRTPDEGVSGPLAFVESADALAPGSLAGKIAVFHVPDVSVPLSFFINLGYEGTTYDPDGELSPNVQYKRPYLSIEAVIAMLDALATAGAIGAVGILDYPRNGAEGAYFPYDGVLRQVPGVYVDRTTGGALKEQAAAGTTARLTLPAKVKKITSRNLIGFIPGRSKELVTLHCHTDGSNAIEDNGPGAIVAMSQYLARLPKSALPRTIMILLTTGHFAGGNGSQAFLRRHRDDLVSRTNAALTIEHLGVKEWDELPGGRMGPTGRREPGSIFSPGSAALVDAAYEATVRADNRPGGVLRPLNPDAVGQPDEAAWPGEGQYLYAVGGIPDANYIAGPTYLLNWGVKTVDRCNHRRVREQSKAFTEMILRLGRTPRDQLRNYTLS